LTRARSSRTLIGIAGGVVIGAAGLLIAGRMAADPGVEVERIAAPDRFPNVTLRTHDGRTVRFYDDLIAGKTVALNFMYATCKDF